MAEQSKILEVKDLRISFRVDSGTVKAVRGIGFDLYRGRTLCIVGESGSGKSVTSRAILGILAKNALVEGGEIIYDGKDLLTLNEDRFHKIRGSKISMIFQDPLSALNPIMRVGKQLTEPIFLKAKANKRESGRIIADIRHQINRVSKAHGIEVDADLIKKFDAAACEELRIREETEHYERHQAILARRHNAADNPEKYPPQVVAEARRYIAKYEGKVPAPNTVKSVVLTAEERAKLEETFRALIRAAAGEYRSELESLHRKAQEVFNLVQGSDDMDTFRKECKELGHESDACRFAFRDDEDDIIGVFGTSLNKYLDSLKSAQNRAEKAAKHAEKLAQKGEEEKPLTVKQRAKMPEKELSVEEAKQMLIGLFEKYISHLNGLLNNEFDSDGYTPRFLTYYGEQIIRAKKKVSHEEAKETALEIMRQVGIPEPEIRFRQYPFEFSGGMRQRIVIAIALSSRPEVLICDEPTTALDVTIQAQILELINQLKEELNLSIIFITHDLGVVANMADDIAVMYAGKIVEYGTVDDIFYDPRHPYTWALLSSMPDLDTKQKLDAIPGTPPNMVLPPKGDAFAARNKYAMAIDFEQEPPLFQISETHAAATWLLLPDAPKAVPPEIVTARIERAMAKRRAKKGDAK